MTDEEALVSAIRAAPGDDTGRLVYADWLDECGTTDRHRARSEWIRLTCWTPATRKDRITGKRFRVPGEPAWLRANAHRLWPALYALKAPWWKNPVSPKLLTGQVTLSIPLAIPTGKGSEELIDYTNVTIFCERGVSTEAFVTFVRAARVAPAAALDEPFARVTFATVPDRCHDSLSGGSLVVYRRPFEMRGLAGVWDALPGTRGTECGPMPSDSEEYKTAGGVAGINGALTAWARERADILRQGAPA